MNQDLWVADERIGDDEREHVVRELTKHCGDGRLTLDELEERTAAAYAAMTKAELDHLLRDLPHDSPAAPTAPRPAAPPPTDSTTPVRTTRQLDTENEHEAPIKAICLLLVVAGITLLFNGSLILAILCWVAAGSLKNRFL